MQATQVINTHLKKMCQAIHKKRLKTLMIMVVRTKGSGLTFNTYVKCKA